MEDLVNRLKPLFRGWLASVLVVTVCAGYLLGLSIDPTIAGFAGITIAFYYKEKEK